MQEAIDLSTLRVVVAAADLGSISAASERLQLAVAAASCSSRRRARCWCSAAARC
jgi:DNA-binding transcriptional LysR family regulator